MEVWFAGKIIELNRGFPLLRLIARGQCIIILVGFDFPIFFGDAKLIGAHHLNPGPAKLPKSTTWTSMTEAATLQRLV